MGEAIERRRGLWYGQDLELSLEVIETSCAEFHMDLALVMAAAPANLRLWRREQIDMLADFLDEGLVCIFNSNLYFYVYFFYYSIFLLLLLSEIFLPVMNLIAFVTVGIMMSEIFS